MEFNMGDQVGIAVNDSLTYVPFKEFERILSMPIGIFDKTKIFATLCRINTLYMIARAGSGHIGSSFSSLDIMSWLQLNYENNTLIDKTIQKNIFFSSKGHDAPALYSTWIGLGKLDFELIHQLRRLNGLPGHPDISTPNVVTNTGSLGMGVSKAKGLIFANRLKKCIQKVYVLTGDGELQEGQFWESLISAANENLFELTVIIDHNKLQSDNFIYKVSDLGNLEAKLSAFGWHVSRCNGNKIEEFAKILDESDKITDKPKIIIADTIKGCGVSFMEHTSIDSDVDLYKFHSGAPTQEAYDKANNELINYVNLILIDNKANRIKVKSIKNKTKSVILNQERLINSYSSALVSHARKNPNIIALDADLILDTGLIPFKNEFPDRFVECGIAEQDMVSQAGGMALQGLLPIVHSFSCFLSSRPNEQIYNNSTENTKIIYVGSLAGILPAGPGHSHQSVRDISSLGGIPNLKIVEPSCEIELLLLLDWCILKYEFSSYLRLVSIPYKNNFKLPDDYCPKEGTGVTIRNGEKYLLITYGPILIEEALKAADVLCIEDNIHLKIINLPWLNYIDEKWLESEVNNFDFIISLDNQYTYGSQGMLIGNLLSKLSIKINFLSIAIMSIPKSGSNEEILIDSKLNYEFIISKIRNAN
jgi:transketolase